jgi:transketolase
MSTESMSELGQQLRVDSVRSSAAAGSGHPTSSMSAADLMAVLLDGGYLRMDTSDLGNPANDHLIFSKGHASPLYYAVLKAAGIIDDAELLSFRKLDSRL